jgi:hypothetical protein
VCGIHHGAIRVSDAYWIVGNLAVDYWRTDLKEVAGGAGVGDDIG